MTHIPGISAAERLRPHGLLIGARAPIAKRTLVSGRSHSEALTCDAKFSSSTLDASVLMTVSSSTMRASRSAVGEGRSETATVRRPTPACSCYVYLHGCDALSCVPMQVIRLSCICADACVCASDADSSLTLTLTSATIRHKPSSVMELSVDTMKPTPCLP